MSFTMVETAQRLACSLVTVERLIRSGRLPVDKAPGRVGAVRVSEEAIAALLDERARTRADSLTVRQAARAMDCALSTVRRLIAKGELARYPMPTREVRVTRESARHHSHAA